MCVDLHLNRRELCVNQSNQKLTQPLVSTHWQGTFSCSVVCGSLHFFTRTLFPPCALVVLWCVMSSCLPSQLYKITNPSTASSNAVVFDSVFYARFRLCRTLDSVTAALCLKWAFEDTNRTTWIWKSDEDDLCMLSNRKNEDSFGQQYKDEALKYIN